MTKRLERFRQSGSFIAGLLIGFSIVVITFALTDTDSTAWQTILVFGGPAILVLGFVLQLLVTAEPWRRHAMSAERVAVLS